MFEWDISREYRGLYEICHMYNFPREEQTLDKCKTILHKAMCSSSTSSWTRRGFSVGYSTIIINILQELRSHTYGLDLSSAPLLLVRRFSAACSTTTTKVSHHSIHNFRQFSPRNCNSSISGPSHHLSFTLGFFVSCHDVKLPLEVYNQVIRDCLDFVINDLSVPSTSNESGLLLYTRQVEMLRHADQEIFR